MTAAVRLRKGWCPGALRPMPAKDGWLVRLRITGSILPASSAHAIADLARTFGNGAIDLSGRANLQLRGVREAGWPSLLAALDDLGLLDHDPDAESVRNILSSPLAGLHEGLDIRPLVRELEAALTSAPRLRDLPPKILWLVDDGAAPSLAMIGADVRFDLVGDAISVGLGGTRETAVRIGTCSPDVLAPTADRIGHALVALFATHTDLRRVAGLVGRVGAEALAEACGGRRQPPLVIPPEGRITAATVTGPLVFGHRSAFGASVPFGRLDARMLRVAAGLSTGEIRLTPWRSIFLPDAASAPTVIERLSHAGFIVDVADRRLDVAACTGRDGCEHATTATHEDAAALAAFASARRQIHVSGCAKGCAHAAPAPVTLVGREGRYDLVLDGRAGDEPIARNLDLAGVRQRLAEL